MARLVENTSAEVVVVGGGIIGISCAYALSRDGWQVAVLERLGLASGTSSACQGGVGFGLSSEGYDLHLSRAAVAAYENLAAEGVDVEYHRDGTLFVGEPEEDDEIKARIKKLQEVGIACEWLDQVAIRDEEPALSPSLSGAAVIQDSGNVYPMRVVVELARRANRFGTHIYTETELTGIEMKHGKVSAALTAGRRIATEKIIIAAGVWSPSVCQFVGLKVPVWPLKGHILVSEPVVPRMLRHYINDTRYEATVDTMREVEIGAGGPKPVPPQFATVLHSFENGHILIGSSREFAGYNREVDRGRLKAIARLAARLVPGLAEVRIIRTYAGLRPWTPDGLPMVGPTTQAEGVFFATGHAGDGNTLAILTGNIIADLLSGRETAIETDPLSPDRFIM